MKLLGRRIRIFGKLVWRYYWLITTNRPMEEGRWLSNYCKLQNSKCFTILRGFIFRINLAIRPKSGRNSFFWAKFGAKTPKIVDRISWIAGRSKVIDVRRVIITLVNLKFYKPRIRWKVVVVCWKLYQSTWFCILINFIYFLCIFIEE